MAVLDQLIAEDFALYNGDCIEVMCALPKESVHLSVYSPPFGGLYGLPVIADACLARQDTVAINGGTHTDVIELRWGDFVQTEHPRIVSH